MAPSLGVTKLAKKRKLLHELLHNTHINPTKLPASKASIPPIKAYTSGIIQAYCQAFFPFPNCIATAQAATAMCVIPYTMSVHSKVNRQMS